MKNYVTTNLILDDQGGQQISVRTDGKSPTLRAEMHGNLPCVCSAGFKPSQGAKAKGMGFEMEKSPTLLAGQEPGVCITFEPGIASRVGGHVYENISGTLRATPGDNQMAIALENHPNDSRVKIDDSGTVQTLTSRCGTGGGNVPMVLEPVCFQQNQREEVRIMDVLGALMAESGMHNTNYVVFSKIRRAKSKDDFETWKQSVCTNTLNTFDQGDVRATDMYIVRRLTPLECNRLQGFPDGWGEIDHKEDFTEEEYQFWLDVRNTWAAINGKQVKDYTKEQMLKWYNKLHTDSAEYKMWGNGIGLPNALYVMKGIAESEKRKHESEE